MSPPSPPGSSAAGVPQLGPLPLAALGRLCAAAERIDGAAPVDEATWRRLRSAYGADDARWLGDVAGDSGGGLIGAAFRCGDEAHVVVHPDHRGRGHGRQLTESLLTGVAPSTRLTAWSHGGHPAAAALADDHGFERHRELWVMRRPGAVPLPELASRPELRLESYSARWQDALLEVNATAFADHPEQGAMDANDLAARMDEAWFDPDDLLLAVTRSADGQEFLAGFHWTKRHLPDPSGATAGEIYVIAVAPEAQGRGLGRWLALAGLHHLRRRGAAEVHLYVEADNLAARTVYERLGFGHAPADTHVQYLREGSG